MASDSETTLLDVSGDGSTAERKEDNVFVEESRGNIDSYTHPSHHIIYSPVNIPGCGANIEDFEEQYLGCDCLTESQCCTNECSCLKRFGKNYCSGLLLDAKFNGPILECNSECRCGEECGNRLVQFGPQKGLEVIRTGDKGLGLISNESIPKNSFVCEYAGEVIGLDEAKRRSSLLSGSADMNYIFVLREHLRDGSVLQTCVDPMYIGNIGRYINHSCDPNTIILPVRVENIVPRLCVFSVRDIAVGEEITFDYGASSQFSVQTTSNDAEAANRKQCKCGASSCRRILPFDQTILV